MLDTYMILYIELYDYTKFSKEEMQKLFTGKKEEAVLKKMAKHDDN